MYDPQASTPPSSLQVRPRGLSTVQDLLDRLHRANLTYCHWKGNEHLDDAVAGRTDLDILVERGRSADLQLILAESGFRRFAPQSARAHPGVEDYLAFDQPTGALVHLHLHYRLPLGQKHYSGHRLPWEIKLLATRVLDPCYGIYVTNPALELVVLLMRAAVKWRLRDQILGRTPADLQRFKREFSWLRDRVDIDEVCRMSSALLGPSTEGPLRLLLADPEQPKRLRLFARAVQPMLHRYRSYGPIVSPLLASLREFQWLADAINRRYLHLPIPLRRVSPRGGTVIALLGSDGSGKSSLGTALTSWLGTKLDVMPVYFGSGDGPSSAIRLPLVLMRRLLTPILNKEPSASPKHGEGAVLSDTSWRHAQRRIRAAALVPWALALSIEKRSKMRRMGRARNRGMIVVCDRFAQADIQGFNDGPLLAHWRGSRWRILRAVAAWEAKPHKETQLNPPDLVLKLNVTPEIALTRRPDMNLEEIRRRVQAVQSLRFPEMVKVVDIGADAPFEEVVLAAKKLVWDHL